MPHRLAVLTDFPDEGWPSMDLCGDMLLRASAAGWAARRAGHPPLPAVPSARHTGAGDRTAPGGVQRRPAAQPVRPLPTACPPGRSARFDLFHVADHTYAQLVHALPAGRTGVYCHDLDAFRCLFDRAAEPRPHWFRAMAGRILTGLRKAAVVFHSTAAVGERDWRGRSGSTPDRLVLAPLGWRPSSSPSRRDPRWICRGSLSSAVALGAARRELHPAEADRRAARRGRGGPRDGSGPAAGEGRRRVVGRPSRTDRPARVWPGDRPRRPG